MLGIRTKNIEPTKAVCRCLFGPIDHTEVKKTLGKELARIETENNDRWNFNFQEELPITGKFTWVKLNDADDVPVAYKMPNLGLTNYLALVNLQQIIRERREHMEANSENEVSEKEKTTEAMSLTEETTEVPSSNQRQSRKRKRSVQIQITEYFPHKRKAARMEKSLH